MTTPISGSDSNRNTQGSQGSQGSSQSPQQSAAQTGAGRNIGQESSYFQSQLGGRPGSSAQQDLSAAEAEGNQSTTRSSSTQDSGPTKKPDDKKDDKKTDKKEDKKTDTEDKGKKTDADVQGNVPQTQKEAGPVTVDQKPAMTPHVEINNIVNQVVDKLQVSLPQLNGGQEVRMTLKTPGMSGTEVRITKTGDDLNIAFKTDTPESMQFLMEHVGTLQDGLSSKLPNLNININVGNPPAQDQGNEGRSRGGGGGQQGQGQQGQQGQGQQK